MKNIDEEKNLIKKKNEHFINCLDSIGPDKYFESNSFSILENDKIKQINKEDYNEITKNLPENKIINSDNNNIIYHSFNIKQQNNKEKNNEKQIEIEEFAKQSRVRFKPINHEEFNKESKEKNILNESMLSLTENMYNSVYVNENKDLEKNLDNFHFNSKKQ